jgi:hypothetical protein
MKPRIVLGALAYCALLSPITHAGDVRWRVALSSSDPGISLPQLPAGHGVVGAGLADGGAGVLGFQLRPFNATAPDGNWFERGGALAAYAQVGATGALGPGRSGAESSHVFRRLYYGDSAGEGARAFGATANDPSADPGDASLGIWLWDGKKNVEIARLGTDGPLGPGLGSGLVYKSLHHVDDTDNDVNVWMLPNRRVLFAGRIGTSSGVGNDGLSVHTPGVGNAPCMLIGSTDADVGPGISAAAFSGISARKAVSPRGEVYALASARPVAGAPAGWFGSDGIWQFCDGAPRPGVLTGFTGEYGPGFDEDTAVFGGDANGLWGYVAPSLPGSYFFSSGGRMSTASGAPAFFGLFHHDAAARRNRPLVLENSQGRYGPQIDGYVFNTSVVPYNVKAAGRYAALQTSVSPVGNASARFPGLWRIDVDGTVEPVALSGDTGAYAPAPGRIWNGTFYRFAIFDNGDIVTAASTKNVADGTTAVSWWRLRRGAAPVEILKTGDLVQVPTPGGVVERAVTGLDPQYQVALPLSAGRDVWFTANGNMLIGDVTIQGFESTTTILRGVAAQPDYLFATGND